MGYYSITEGYVSLDSELPLDEIDEITEEIEKKLNEAAFDEIGPDYLVPNEDAFLFAGYVKWNMCEDKILSLSAACPNLRISVFIKDENTFVPYKEYFYQGKSCICDGQVTYEPNTLW